MSPTPVALDLGPPSLPWRLTLAMSIGLHLFGFLLFFGLPRLLPSRQVTPVYVVDLVSLAGGSPAGSQPPAGAAAKPAAQAPAEKKKEEKSIKIPERAAKKAEAKKTPEPKRTPEPKKSPPPSAAQTKPAETQETGRATTPASGHAGTATQAPGAAGGTGAAGGGYGGGGVEQTDALNFYGALVKRNIENAWKKPLYPSSETTRKVFTTQVRVIVTSSGRVTSVEILVPSGYEAMDQSVLDAVHEAIFPPFPSSLSYSVLALPLEVVLTPD